MMKHEENISVNVLADVTEQNSEAILEHWARRVDSDLVSGNPPETGLRDHIPVLLKELVAVLRRGLAPAMSAAGQEHGRQRYRRGFNLSTLVREYEWLSEVILDLAERQDRVVPLGEVRIFNAFIARALAEGVAEQERQARFTGLLADVSHALAHIPEMRPLLQRCVQALVDRLDAAFARVWLLDATEKTLVLHASAGLYTHLDGPHGRVPVGQFKIGRIAQERRPHLTNSVVGDPRVGDQAWARREGLVAFAGYPLLVGEKLVGVVALFARHVLPPDTLDALRQVADTMALGVERMNVEARNIVLLARESAARAQAETERQRLHDIFLRAPAAICVTEGPEHRCVLANPLYMAMVGGRDVLGRTVAQALPEVVEQGVIGLLDTAYRTGVAYVGQETWLRLQRAPQAPLEDVCLNFVCQPIQDARGQTRSIFTHAVDVTELVLARREAQRSAEALRLNERRLEDALAVTQTGTWEMDPTNNRLTADPRFREMFGLTPEEPFDLVKGLAIIHPEDRKRVTALVENALAGRDHGRFEADYRTVPRPDGSIRWMAARGQTTFDASGRATRFLGTGTDITARKQTELARARLLDSIADQDVFGVAVLEGPELRFTLANEGYRLICGGRDVLGKPMLEALPELAGQGSEDVLFEILRTGKPVTAAEARFMVDMHGTGALEARFFTFTWQAIPSPDGGSSSVLVLSHDITEGVRARIALEAAAERLHRSETRLALALQVSGTGTWELDLKTGRILMDARFREMFGLIPDEPLTLEARLTFVHPEDRARVAHGVSDALAGKNGGAYAAEYRTAHLAADGRSRWISTRGQAYFDPDGQAVRLVGTGLDITESVRARERAEALAQQERTRAEFAQQLIGIVSHDLRNPLGAIRLGTATLLRREGLDPKSRQVVERIQSTTERAQRMVRDLLDFTQVRLAGGLKIERQSVELHELVRGVVQEVEEAHPGARIRQEARGAGRGVWDADRLAQVVQNLVTNALKYGTPGEWVSVFTEGNTDRVTLGVHNPGEPISPERQASLFQPMQRGVEGVDRQGRSVGLGLFIVRAIVEAHGGTIELTSQAGEGTTFRVLLPREAPTPTAATRRDATG